MLFFFLTKSTDYEATLSFNYRRRFGNGETEIFGFLQTRDTVNVEYSQISIRTISQLCGRRKYKTPIWRRVWVAILITCKISLRDYSRCPAQIYNIVRDPTLRGLRSSVNPAMLLTNSITMTGRVNYVL